MCKQLNLYILTIMTFKPKKKFNSELVVILEFCVSKHACRNLPLFSAVGGGKGNKPECDI